MEALNKPAIQNGFKQTEVGQIPMDWGTKSIKEFCNITTGSQDTQDRVENGDYPFFVRSNKVERINSFSFDGEAILTSGDGVGVGKIFHHIDGKFDFHQRVYAMHSFNNNVFPKYFFFYFSKYFFERVMQMTAKSSVDSVRREMIADMQIPLPPTLNEQRTIANALSDIDEHINNLQKLIDKKTNIKKGAMQELLTPPQKGGKRLPGFSGDWEKKKLGDVADCLDHLRKPLNEYERSLITGDIPYCGANGIVDHINDYLIDDNIILLAEDGGYFDQYMIRPIAYEVNGKCWVNNHAHVLKSKKNNEQKFLYYSIVHKNILDYVTGGTRAKLNKKSMLKILLFIPISYHEQTAIAQILTDMDKEIEKLEAQKEKYSRIKKGMLQQLLTGKIRLV